MQMIIRCLVIFVLLLSWPAQAQRLTLASHQPIMTTSQPSRSTLFVDCWKGYNGITIWNGSSDVTMAIPGCEMPISLSTLNANDVFDLMETAAGPCLPTNGSGAGWSGDGGSLTSRGSGYSQIDTTSHAYPTNKNAISHCYNGATDYGPVAANQGTLVGSVCTDTSAAGKVSYVLGSIAAGGGAARLCVWSVFDEPVQTEVIDNGPNWTFLGYMSGGSIIDIENLDTPIGGGAGNQVTFLSGLALRSPQAGATIEMGSSVAFIPCYCGIGLSLDHGGSTAPDILVNRLSPAANTDVAADGVSWEVRSTGMRVFPPITGVHYFQAQETTDGLSRCWFRTVGGQRSGLLFNFMM